MKGQKRRKEEKLEMGNKAMRGKFQNKWLGRAY